MSLVRADLGSTPIWVYSVPTQLDRQTALEGLRLLELAHHPYDQRSAAWSRRGSTDAAVVLDVAICQVRIERRPGEPIST